MAELQRQNGPICDPLASVWPVTNNYLTCPNTPPAGIPLRKNDEKTTITKALHSVDMRAFVGTKLSHARNFRLV